MKHTVKRKQLKETEKRIKSALSRDDQAELCDLLGMVNPEDFQQLSVYIRRRLSGWCLEGGYQFLNIDKLLMIGYFIKESRLWMNCSICGTIRENDSAKTEAFLSDDMFLLDAMSLNCILKACRPDIRMTERLSQMIEEVNEGTGQEENGDMSAGLQECRAMLLAYRQQHFPEGSLAHREDVLFEKEIGITDLTDRDLRLDYEFRAWPDGMHMIRYKGADEMVIVPDTYKMQTVTGIGRRAFAGTKVKQIVIQRGVASIEQRCFENCENLHTITLPDSINRIEGRLFSVTKTMNHIFRASGRSEFWNDTVVRCSEKVFQLLDPSDRMMMVRAYFLGNKNLEEDMKATIHQYISEHWMEIYREILDEDWQMGLRRLLKLCQPSILETEEAWDEALSRFAMGPDYYEITARTLLGSVAPLIEYMYCTCFDELHTLYQEDLMLLYLATDLNTGSRVECVEQMIAGQKDRVLQLVHGYDGQEIADHMQSILAQF